MSFRYAVCKKVADFNYIFLRELRILDLLAVYLAILDNFIGNVVIIRAEPKMRGIAARGIVTVRAIMQNMKIVGNIAIRQNPGHAVRAYTLAIAHNLSVTICIFAARPKPTFMGVSLLDTGPKAIGKPPFIILTQDDRGWLPDYATGRLLRREFLVVVPGDVMNWLSLNPAARGHGLWGESCLLAATAMAVTKGYFVKVKLGLGRLWGSIHGVFSASNASDQAAGLSQAIAAVFRVVYSFILAHLGEKRKAQYAASA